MKRPDEPRIIDFQKEQLIQEITRSLKTWPLYRVQIVAAAIQAHESNQGKVSYRPHCTP